MRFKVDLGDRLVVLINLWLDFSDIDLKELSLYPFVYQLLPVSKAAPEASKRLPVLFQVLSDREIGLVDLKILLEIIQILSSLND